MGGCGECGGKVEGSRGGTEKDDETVLPAVRQRQHGNKSL